MGVLNSIIPISVLSAILLFIARESLDLIKKKRADKRKLEAIKKLVARELELNLGAIKNIRQIIASAKNCLHKNLEIGEDFNFAIQNDGSGEKSFCVYIEGDKLVSRTPIRSVHAELLGKYLLDIATLENSLSIKADIAYDAQMELAHVRKSLLKHLDPTHPEYEEELAAPFCEYAIGELEEIFSSLNALYVAAKGKHLTDFRLR